MRSEQITKHIDDIEICHGEAICKQKSRQLLQDMSLPQGLLPLNDVVEFGFNRTSGFVWLRQKVTKEDRFCAIGRSVSYDTEVTAFVEEHRLRRLTGVKCGSRGEEKRKQRMEKGRFGQNSHVRIAIEVGPLMLDVQI